MSKRLDKKEIINSLDNISKLGKSVAHPKRLQILVLLLDEQRDFSTLIEETDLKKTALSKHLSQLMENSLVAKHGRGIYYITTDGKELLKAVTLVYKDSKSREKLQRDRLSRRYSNVRVKMMEKTEKLISQDPIIEGAWISYIGAVLGVLKAVAKGKVMDRASVGGYTGYAFALPNIMNNGTCPSGPTALAIWDEIVKATSILGFKVHRYYDIGEFFPSVDLTDKDRERARKLFKLIKSSVDNDKPVVLWGLVAIEYGIVKGYIGDFYIVSDIINRKNTQVRYDNLLSPGGLHAIFFDEEAPENSENVDKEAIGRAIKFSEGKLVFDGYVAGSSAYDVWAKILESGSEDDFPYHGNSYNGECILEAKRMSQVFIKRLSEKYQGSPQAKILDKLSQKYYEIVGKMEEFQQIFPFALEGEMPRDKRLKGANILRAIKPLENQALTLLKESYDAWV
ncbi:MAG: ArsR/SmtB family transcription factor [Promethearchaeota archaeon]